MEDSMEGDCPEGWPGLGNPGWDPALGLGGKLTNDDALTPGVVAEDWMRRQQLSLRCLHASADTETKHVNAVMAKMSRLQM